jgi:hypothetical protein
MKMLGSLREIAIQNQCASIDDSFDEILDKRAEFVRKSIEGRDNFIFEDGTVVDTTIKTMQIIFGAGGGALFLKQAKDILIKWIETRSYRTLEIEVGKRKFKVRNIKELKSAINLLEEKSQPGSGQRTSPGRRGVSKPRRRRSPDAMP